VSAFTVLVAVLSIGSITAGSLYQKSAVARTDLRTTVAVQNFGAAVVAAGFALALGETRWLPSPTLWLSLAWGVAMLSGGAIVLLVWLLRHGGAARATSLMFLAPPLAALQGYALFGETLGATQLAGFAVALAGVALARWSR
jgi:drug/metabolite transporter (DMT)-like permease